MTEKITWNPKMVHVILEKELKQLNYVNPDISRSAITERAIKAATELTREDWINLNENLFKFKQKININEASSIPTSMVVTVEDSDCLNTVQENIKAALELKKLFMPYFMSIIWFAELERIKIQSNDISCIDMQKNDDLTPATMSYILTELLLKNEDNQTSLDKRTLSKIKLAMNEWQRGGDIMGKNEFQFLVWNTELFSYGQYKNIEDSPHLEVFSEIKDFMKNNNGIAVLQEIPYKIKGNVEHPIWLEFLEVFANEYDIVSNPYNPSNGKKSVIKQTVIIANKGLIKKAEVTPEDGNIFVPFNICVGNQKLLALGVHAHDALELRTWLASRKDRIVPDIILGDFNAGDYSKASETTSFKNNRDNYIQILNSYKDICEGRITTKYGTSIDHVLINKDSQLNLKDMTIDYDVKSSDHYPILCEVIYN